MKLHEFQAKRLLAQSGLPVPRSQVVFGAGEVMAALHKAEIFGGVAKAQAFTGGRGKAGGVKIFHNPDESWEVVNKMIGMTLVTKQTGPEGLKVSSVLLEQASYFDKEMYLAITLDRAKASLVIMLSPEGGMDIEEVAERSPEKILKLYPEYSRPMGPVLRKQASEFMGLDGGLGETFGYLLEGLYSLYQKYDCMLMEINPLVVTKKRELLILDCKMVLDENALFRQKETGGDPDAEKVPAEIEAAKYGMSYIKLDGNIGCMVNGAGLAMATMDIIAHFGEQPANFLDVGGSATEDAVTKAFQLITSDSNVKAILVNIFGGIMKCDTIALGIINAVKSTKISVPLVVRLEGNRVSEGKALLDHSGLNIISASDLLDGARKVAAAVKGTQSSAPVSEVKGSN